MKGYKNEERQVEKSKLLSLISFQTNSLQILDKSLM